MRMSVDDMIDKQYASWKICKKIYPYVVRLEFGTKVYGTDIERWLYENHDTNTFSIFTSYQEAPKNTYFKQYDWYDNVSFLHKEDAMMFVLVFSASKVYEAVDEPMKNVV